VEAAAEIPEGNEGRRQNEGRKRAHKPVTSQPGRPVQRQQQHHRQLLHLARSVLSAEMAGGGTRDGRR
jgi:hypothetical protein